MENNYELHLNQIIYSLDSKQFPMVDMVIIGKVRQNYLFYFLLKIFLVIDSIPSLPSFSQLNTLIRQSNNLTPEHLCLIRACLIKQQKINQ